MTGQIALWIALVVGPSTASPTAVVQANAPEDAVIAAARTLFDSDEIDEGIATLEAGASEAEARGERDVAADRWEALGEHHRARIHSKFEAALAAHERALALRLAARPGGDGNDDSRGNDSDDAGVARSLDLVGDCLRRLGRLADASSRADDGLAMRRRLFSGDHPDVATSLHTVASCLDSLGRFAEATPRFEEALAMRRRLFPGDHADVAATLGDFGACLTRLGRFVDARENLEAALAMRRRLFPGDHPDVAATVNDIADYDRISGSRLAEAVATAEEALAMDRRLHSDDHPDLARSLTNVAWCLVWADRNSEALPKAEEALAMRRRLHTGDHPDVAISLAIVGHCRLKLGSYTEALSWYEERLAMQRRLTPGGHPELAAALMSIASTLHYLGRSAEALPKFEESIAMNRRLFPRDHPAVAVALGWMSTCLAGLGRHAEARPLVEEVLAIQRRLNPGDHPDVARALVSVGQNLGDLGLPAEALPKYEEALAMTRRLFGEDHVNVAVVLHDIAICLKALGRPAEALPIHEESLAIFRRSYAPDHPFVAISLSNLATCFTWLNRSDKALALYEEVLSIHRRTTPGDHPKVVIILSNIALTLKELGRHEECHARFEEALAMSQRLYPGDHPLVASNLLFLAHAFQSRDRIPEALAKAEDALAMRRRLFPSGNRALVESLTQVAQLMRSRSPRDSEAAELLTEAISMLESLRRSHSERALDPRQRAEYSARWRRLDPYPTLRRIEVERGRADAALAVVERSNGRFFLDLLEGASFDALDVAERDIRGRGDEALAASIVALRGALDRVDAEDARLTHEVTRIAADRALSADERMRQRVALDAGFDALAVERRRCESERARAIADVLPVLNPATPDDVRGALQSGELFLSFALDAVQSHLFVVDRERVEVVAIAAEPAEVARFVDGPRASGAESLDEPVALASRGRRLLAAPNSGSSPGLFQSLIPPEIWDRIRHASRVYVMTDGALHRFPLETLAVAPGRTWLDDGPPIAYVPSGSVLVWLGRRSATREPNAADLDVVALGDPVFTIGDGGRGEDAIALAREGQIERFGGLLPLPGTRGEALAAANAFASDSGSHSSVLLAADATEANLFELAARARYLHLATHGLADEVAGESLSALALTFPSVATAEDDGFLKLGELIHRWRGRLESCEMVVLSACETQVGVEQRDNGPFALSFGFLFAGASSVISSLWAVNDESTAALMSDFYARLAKAGPNADRLAEFVAAKKAMKESGAPVSQWAPFIYVGSPH